MQTGIVFDIKEFAVHDGPGIRTTVFMKGCPLRCSWCHNPEGLRGDPEPMERADGERMVGQRYDSKELAAILNRQAPILRRGEGGVTFSGGEPLAQAAFVAEVIDRLVDIHVLLDTSGYADEGDFRLVAGRCDLIYFDLKLIDDDLHKRFTGKGVAPTLRNLAQLSHMGKPCVIRTPLIPGVTDTRENLSAIAEAARGVNGLIRVELLPYNRAAGGKYAACGLGFEPGFDEAGPVSTDTTAFEQAGVAVRVM